MRTTTRCVGPFQIRPGFPPLLLLSKRLDKIVQQVPIQHVHVLMDTCRGHQSCKTLFATKVLLSIRSPVQVLAFTGGTAITSDWSPVLSYVKSCPYPNQVLKLRVRHRNACNSIDPAPVSGVLLLPERPIDAMRQIIFQDIISNVHDRILPADNRPRIGVSKLSMMQMRGF